ncbi:glycoside hydrolase family 31 protein [Martelella endophytica]|uniref:Alpha-glucosidase n=1 Tax=Martelella endophytica TaxID=1486262 RepID=A0A0D5LP87_MAREN|nr:glycoside hydrolase family 31 protein [Martelella endophytica]AJY45133.1 alpha-glucosidase [Martelella endophytica]
MRTLKNWKLAEQNDHAVRLIVDDRHSLDISVLEETLFRVALRKDGTWRLDRTWSIAPTEDVPAEGRSRDDLAGFSRPRAEVKIDTDACRLTIATATLRVTVERPLTLRWEHRTAEGNWALVAEERPTGAYMLGIGDHRNSHFLLRKPGERVYGLGEKAGDLERSGRRFEMRNLDAMGYDARTTDPLYKHLPVTFTVTPEAGAFSLFYDNLSSCWFDIGNEFDNYHKPFRAYRATDGDLDYYFAWATKLLDLVRNHTRLTGGTAFMPRWALGYSGSTMAYTDRPNAQQELEGFLAQLAEYDIPCDSFQMSSGYTSIDGKRYVFNWNEDKFPDVEGMTRHYAAADVTLIANIKPALLQDHPRFREALEAGLFIRDSESEGYADAVFWDDSGAHLDFTNPAAVAWWKDGVTTQLLERGIACTWNDNNEYEIWDDGARCHGFGREIPIALIRPLHSMLMSRASRDAQQAFAPESRPYLISRAGCPGIQRYAQTWTGDNYTRWETLRYNIRMGLGLSLSGIYNIGHDVGGFSGPKPEPELFVRWVQNGIFHPRFTIHSWNDDGTANEPWMYPDVLPLIRQAIRLRYRLLPYLYTQTWMATCAHEPILRPTFLDHPDDQRTYDETDDFMLGRDILVANVVDKAATERDVYLPENATGWWDARSGQYHAPGTSVTVPVALDSIPLFIRAGAVIPLCDETSRAHEDADRGRTIALFPVPDRFESERVHYDDDGQTTGWQSPEAHAITTFRFSGDGDALSLSRAVSGQYQPGFRHHHVWLPQAETRRLRCNGFDATPGQAPRDELSGYLG